MMYLDGKLVPVKRDIKKNKTKSKKESRFHSCILG